MRISVIVVALVFSLVGCRYSLPDIQPQQLNVVSLDPANWYVFYSAGTPANPSYDGIGAWSLAIPNAGGGGHLNYVQTPFVATTTLHNVIMKFEVISTSPQYVEIDPTDKLPATFRIFFEQKNDDMESANGRWWADFDFHDLGSNDNQIITISVPFTWEQWGNVYGQQNAQNFAAALANVGWIGMTFGGQYFAGHGVALNSGSATFDLIDFYVN
jgi:hypothetical protein